MNASTRTIEGKLPGSMSRATLDTLSRVTADLATFTKIRRELHQDPELAYEEHNTAARVVAELGALGIETHRGLGGTGVVGVIRGNEAPATGQKARTVLLRADMDALPMQEANTFAHRSQHAHRMHACGHDGHTTTLLAAAKELATQRDFAGTVVLVFQPAEEGGSGAKKMIDDGLFERFPVDAVFALHNWPALPLGQVAVHAGSVMAATDRVEVRIHGRGGHAAMPHLAQDPVPVAAQIITGLQQIASRFSDPLDAVVVSITSVVTSQTTAFNVIPEHVDLLGTVRTLSEGTRTQAEKLFGAICTNISAAFGSAADVNYIRGYPATVNTTKEADMAARAAVRVFGGENVHRGLPPSMGGEDFAFMLEKKPGAYVWLGQGDADHKASLHNPHYDFNDNALPKGATWLVEIAKEALRT